MTILKNVSISVKARKQWIVWRSWTHLSAPEGLSGFSYPQRIHRTLCHCKFSQPNKMTTPKLCTLAGSTWHYPQHRNKVQKNCSNKHASWPKRGEVTSQHTQSISPRSTPSYPLSANVLMSNLLITWNTNNSHHHIFQLWPLLLAVFPP